MITTAKAKHVASMEHYETRIQRKWHAESRDVLSDVFDSKHPCRFFRVEVPDSTSGADCGSGLMFTRNRSMMGGAQMTDGKRWRLIPAKSDQRPD